MLDVSVCAQCLEVSPQNKIIKENEMVYEGTSVQFAQQLPESESHSVEYHSLQPHGLYSSWNSPGQNTGVGSCSLLHGIFPTQGSNPDLPHCRWILYQLSHQGSPRILEWVAYPFSRSSRSRTQTRVYCIARGFFTNWAIRQAPYPRPHYLLLELKPTTWLQNLSLRLPWDRKEEEHY